MTAQNDQMMWAQNEIYTNSRHVHVSIDDDDTAAAAAVVVDVDF